KIMTTLLLAGDVGGTKTNFAFYDNEKSSPVFEKSYRNHDFSDMASLLLRLGQDSGATASMLSLAVAGAIRNGVCHMPNLGWYIDSDQLTASFGFDRVNLINDLEANAYGINSLASGQFALINAGQPQADGNSALIAAGTGLGEAILFNTGGSIHVAASEGGHTDFAPQNEEQLALWQYLHKRHKHVSWERVVSGHGLENIYDFLKCEQHFPELGGMADLVAEGGDPAAIIAESALNETSDICMRAMDIFMTAYGAEAGNLALKTLATGGLYIGGGIAPKILPAFLNGAFMSAFLNKGRFSTWMAEIQVKVILEPKTALLGAATYLSTHMIKE
ncbi:MAG: glucokinase, partial [Methylophilaceae bacterium]|nr:glucokinase [Methylophilaceae bacterium]